MIDVPASLTAARRQLLLDALQNEPMELGQILAETGLRPEVAVPIVDALVESGRLARTRVEGVELLEDRDSLSQQYARLRMLPAGADRTAQLERLVERAGELARHGRYSRPEVQSLWDSGHDGRRVVALGLIQARPELGVAAVAVEGIRAPRSDIEQLHALKAAIAMAPRLDRVDLDLLRSTAEAALASGGLGSDREALAKQLAAL